MQTDVETGKATERVSFDDVLRIAHKFDHKGSRLGLAAVVGAGLKIPQSDRQRVAASLKSASKYFNSLSKIIADMEA